VTYKEFLKRLRATKQRFQWRLDKGKIVTEDDHYHDPITAVCELVTRECLPTAYYADAATKLRLGNRLRRDIITAYHDYPDVKHDVRRDLLRATGLLPRRKKRAL